jgi:predicted Ser/Thr protein kinase
VSYRSEAFEIFAEALALDGSTREAYLARRCSGASELRAAVERLLREDAATRSGSVDALLDVVGAQAREARAHWDPAGPADQQRRCLPRNLGRYVLEAELGAGAMGVVYRARQAQPERVVALKLLTRGLDQAADRERFELEARVLARLRHPGIAHLYDAGAIEEDGRALPFLAMELVEGLTLAQWARAAPRSIDALLGVLVDIGVAVQAAHESGVVHRDLKPANIVVESAGAQARPRILDFGIAAIVSDPPRAAEHEAPRVLGTLSYMSPEQAAGAAVVDGRTDVYALGAIAYELLSGELPHPLVDEPLSARLRRIREEAIPPLGALRPELRGDLERVLARALANAAEQRYPTMSALVADLRAVRERRPLACDAGRPLRVLRSWRRRHPRLALASVLLALCGGLGIHMEREREQRESVERDQRIERLSTAFSAELRALAGVVGTSAPRDGLLRHWLHEVEAALREAPAHAAARDLELRLHRELGSSAIANGRLGEALAHRSKVLEHHTRALVAQPADRVRLAEWAEAQVHVGDVERTMYGYALAHSRNAAAHVVLERLAELWPGDARHVDDLAWSCDRLVGDAIEFGELGCAELLLAQRRRLLDRLHELRPEHPATLSGERCYWALRSHLAHARGDAAQQKEYVGRSLEPARRRWRMEPTSAAAGIEYIGSLLTYFELVGLAALSSEQLAQMREAEHVLRELLAKEPENEVARAQLARWEEVGFSR